jgi:hypothetical protein
MSHIRITAGFLQGTDVHVAALEAIALADRIAVTIEYNFNGVTCLAVPGDDAGLLAEHCMKIMGSNLIIKIARGGPKDAVIRHEIAERLRSLPKFEERGR